MAMIASNQPCEIYISERPMMAQLDVVGLSQRKAFQSAKQFAPSHAKEMRKTTDGVNCEQTIEFDSFEYAQKMAKARMRREQTSKGFHADSTAPPKCEGNPSGDKHDTLVDEGYASSECDTEISAHETPRANLRLLKELDAFSDKNGGAKTRPPLLKLDGRPRCELENIDEEEELRHLKEQQDMMAKEREVKQKYEKQLEEKRKEEQQMFMMRMEQLEMIRLQKAVAKESGKLFNATNTAFKRPTTAPAKRPARYFDEYTPADVKELTATPSARPATAHGARKAEPASSMAPGAQPAGRAGGRPAAQARPKSATWNPLRKKINAVGPSDDTVPFTTINPHSPKPVEPAPRNAWA